MLSAYCYCLVQALVVLVGIQQWLHTADAAAAMSSIVSDYQRREQLLDVDIMCQAASKSHPRPHSASITDFGGVGDGETLNTVAFQNAVFYLRSFTHKGGGQLYVPRGRWLTGSFNLISHLTLFLDEGAVILGSQDPDEWPLIKPLPSYGRGRELPGWRHGSLIHGEGLEDVIITGGTIDGQGAVWWDRFANKTLNHTRGHLVELVNSTYVLISNITFLNPPFWAVHPIYCSNVVMKHVTVVAPADSPNTDGLLPDSCSNVCIEDCNIKSGADSISIKSGWDEYGIEVGMPSSNVIIRRVICEARSSGISFGSEMSGGVQNVLVRDVTIRNSKTGIQVKTAAGRGGYVTNICIANVDMYNVQTAIGFTGTAGDHPDELYNKTAYPEIDRISFQNITGRNISYAGSFEGLEAAPFRGICLSNITLEMSKQQGDIEWDCCNVQGSSQGVVPQPCPELLSSRNNSRSSSRNSSRSRSDKENRTYELSCSWSGPRQQQQQQQQASSFSSSF